jgi:hypothetical protein
MIEQSKFENYEFTEISFEHFCERFRQMLLDMRSHKFLNGFQEYVEDEAEVNLSLFNIQEEDIFGIFTLYENIVRIEYEDGQGGVDLPDGIVDVYSTIEVLQNKTQLPWLTVGIFNERLNATRKELLSCINVEDNSIHYWSLSEAVDSSPNNIPAEFRLVANKLRASPDQETIN